jgi:MarR family
VSGRVSVTVAHLVRSTRCTTYDSSATPEVGQSAKVPQAREDVGRVALLEELQEAMQREKERRPPEHITVPKPERDGPRRPSEVPAKGDRHCTLSTTLVGHEARHLDRDSHQVRLSLTLELPLSAASPPPASDQPSWERKIESPQPDALPATRTTHGVERNGMTPSEMRLDDVDVALLRELSTSGEVKQAVLLSGVGRRDGSKAARRLRVLAGRGFIARSTDPNDRRAKLVHLMPKGQEALAREQETNP